MKGAKAVREPAEAPFMPVIRLRLEPAAVAGDFFYMSPKPVPVSTHYTVVRIAAIKRRSCAIFIAEQWNCN